MFVNEAKHNKVVDERDQLTQRNQELETQLQAANENSATLQSQVDTVTAERDELTSQLEESTARNTELNDQVQSLTEENATLRSLPGAQTAAEISKTENSHGKNVSDLDRVNEFCSKNGNDINACMQAVDELGI